MKKAIFFVFVLLASISYVRRHYTLGDALKYSKTHADPAFSPAIDYYVGMTAYLRDNYELAIPAFDQLLTDYPTCQYAPLALIRMGTIHSEKSRWEEARSAYQKYLDDFPQGKDVESVKRKYEFIKFK